jgi:transcriptional regulator GlxA family with amidase domain
MPTRYRVGVLTFAGAARFEALVMREAFRIANRAGAPYEVSIMSADGTLGDDRGEPVAQVRSGSFGGVVETLIVPGPEDPAGSCEVSPDVADTVRSLCARARRVVALGSGAFVLAQAGVLSGRKATTHWRHVAALAGRYPDVAVQPFGDVVIDRDIYTTASPAAVIDAAVRILEEDLGRELAAIVAGDFVGTSRGDGYAAFLAATAGPGGAGSPLSRLALSCILTNPAGIRNTKDLAAAVGVSTRHLSRAMRDAVGATPREYLDRVRVDLAQRFLRDGYTVTDTAIRCGFGSTESLRRAFNAAVGMPAAQYQRESRGALGRIDDHAAYAAAS